MTNTITQMPPLNLQKSLQYDLFSTFFGETAELSNTIELWDSIPKYAVSARAQIAMRSPDNRLPVSERRFVFSSRRNGQRVESTCRVSIQPASIKTENGYIDYYPTTDEELVEEVIRKIFADQRCGVHDPKDSVSWVKFSLQMIRKELKARGKTRNLNEIKRSIEILSRTHIALYIDESTDPIYSAPILSDIFRITRKEYLEDSTMTWVARLPVLISKSINDLSYRQFNYGILMSLAAPLSRWLHKRLSLNYTNAGFMEAYEIRYTTIKRDSNLLNYTRESANIKALEEALAELKNAKVLMNWERLQVYKTGRKIIDIKYRLSAHTEFIKEMKAANARLKQSRAALSNDGHPELITKK